MYYNDAKPDKIFYQGLALLKLRRMDEANGRFHKLTSYGEKHLFDKIKMDYFAVSLPDLLIWEDDLTIRKRNSLQIYDGIRILGTEPEREIRPVIK